jgi:isopentenyl-diphosphate Delta-isomerase
MAILSDQVILVDHDDVPLGFDEKLRVHRNGTLHRAFSVFIVNSAGEMLLQQRALDKYHSGGLWSNSCCSHPRPGESTLAAAHRRLREEMGIACALRPVYSFVYRAELDGGLIEHEYDHVLVGQYNGDPQPDPVEVAGWRWATPTDIAQRLESNPDRFSAWFRLLFPELMGSGMLV